MVVEAESESEAPQADASPAPPGGGPGAPRPRGVLGFTFRRILFLAGCASPLVSIPAAEAWSFSSLTEFDPTGLVLLSCVFLSSFVLVSPAVAGYLFDRGADRSGLWVLHLALLATVSQFGGCIVKGSVRRNAIARIEERAEPLIAAIRAFERTEGVAPHQLEALVPGYLPAIPSTGMGDGREFRYRWGEAKDVGDLHGNPWALRVPMPTLSLSFDSLIYLPEGNYPEEGFGGRLERMGEWAYVHE